MVGAAEEAELGEGSLGAYLEALGARMGTQVVSVDMLPRTQRHVMLVCAFQRLVVALGLAFINLASSAMLQLSRIHPWDAVLLPFSVL